MKKFWLSLLLLAPMQAWAVLPYDATPAEVAMCEARGMPGGQGRYQGHYCDGLRFIDRAYSAMRNKGDMNYYLGVAINNFDYVLRSTKEDDVKRGEVHIGKARALKLMGRHAEAAAEFNNALRYKPDSPDVYRALADFYYEAGNRQKAMELVTEGLQRNPNSKGLKRRYAELGGKLPYPKAVDKAIVDSEKEAEVDSQAKIESVPLPKNSTDQASDPTKPTVPIEPTPLIESPEIGSKKNPYCRFCPD